MEKNKTNEPFYSGGYDEKGTCGVGVVILGVECDGLVQSRSHVSVRQRPESQYRLRGCLEFQRIFWAEGMMEATDLRDEFGSVYDDFMLFMFSYRNLSVGLVG